MRAFLQDLRYGVRTLTRTPGFTVIAVGVLALGIGANALVFSLANTVFLRPLPAADPATVVQGLLQPLFEHLARDVSRPPGSQFDPGRSGLLRDAIVRPPHR